MKKIIKEKFPQRNLVFAAIILGATTLTSCATVTNYDAAEDIRQFAIGLRDNNYSLIESHIDRPALKRQAMLLTRNIVMDEATKQFGNTQSVKSLSLTLTETLNPIIDNASDIALRPDVLAYFAKQAGVDKNTQIPSRFKASLALKSINSNRVCVPDEDTHECLLYFGKYNDGWKLNGIGEQAMAKTIGDKVEKTLNEKFKFKF